MCDYILLNANAPKDLVNAAILGKEKVIFDLKDSVREEQKKEARILLREAFDFMDYSSIDTYIRINDGAEGMLDVEALERIKPTAYIISENETEFMENLINKIPVESRVCIELSGTDKGRWQEKVKRSKEGRLGVIEKCGWQGDT